MSQRMGWGNSGALQLLRHVPSNPHAGVFQLTFVACSYDSKISSFEDDEGAYDQKDAAGFIKLQVQFCISE